MNRMTWVWMIAAGLMLARLGYADLEADDGGSPVTVTMLVTGGLLLGLLGATGLCGVLGWLAPAERE